MAVDFSKIYSATYSSVSHFQLRFLYFSLQPRFFSLSSFHPTYPFLRREANLTRFNRFRFTSSRSMAKVLCADEAIIGLMPHIFSK
jgi:hypothetical protein